MALAPEDLEKARKLAPFSAVISSLIEEIDRLRKEHTKCQDAVDCVLYCKQQLKTNPGYDTCVDAISDRVDEWHRKYIAALWGDEDE